LLPDDRDDRLRSARRRVSRVDRAGGSSDAGISLIELLVGMLVLSIVSVLIVSLYTSTLKTVTVASELNTNTSQASNGMNELARIIRAGTANPVRGQTVPNPAFVVAQKDVLLMYAYVNLASSEQTPVMVRFHVDGDRRLIESTWPATSLGEGYWRFPDPADSRPSTTRVLASGVTDTASLFSYQRANGSVFTVPSSGLSLADRRLVAAVTVQLRIQGDAGDTSSRVTLRNTVGVPNLGIARSL
jgi:type II secretory pathway pseudopilin PulG